MTVKRLSWYGLLLRCYPRAFRERHGAEMERLYREQLARAKAEGLGSVWRLRVAAALDAVWNGTADRWALYRGRPPYGKRTERGGGGMDGWLKDVRFAVRTLLKNPGFSIVAVATIALGIGANTAIFSVVRGVLLQPLPYEQPEELVLLWGEMRTRGVTHFPHSPPDFAEFQERASRLDGLAGVFTYNVSIVGEGDPVQVVAGGVTTSFFEVIGVEPMLGRAFLPEDGLPGPPGATPGSPGFLPGRAVLSHALWQQRYGGDTDVLGRTVDIGGVPTDIVGIMPPGFELLMPPTAALQSDVAIWLAARIDFVNSPANNVFLRGIGRLADGASPEQLQTEVNLIAEDVARDDQVKSTAGYAVRVEELHSDLTAHVRPILLSLLGAVAFVLLIACANVSNLLLVRASVRDRELAIRSAMGGSRMRLVRQMLIESFVLALVGGGLAVLLALGGIELLVALQPADLPRMAAVRIDGGVLLFTAASSVFAAMLFGAVPAIQASGVDLIDSLKDRGSVSANRVRKLVRNGVVVTEVALSMALLVGAGLMLRSFGELTRVQPGFDAEQVLTFVAAAPFGTYPTAADRHRFQTQLQDRLQGIPGVVEAASVLPLPLSGALFNGRYGPEEALTDPDAFSQATYRGVQPGYFAAMGTRLLQGRTFTEAENADSMAVVLVDDKLAQILWPNGSVIGERFLVRATGPEPEWVEVIGVVEHQRSETLATDGMETVYFPERFLGSFSGAWTVRASVDPLSLVGAIREELGRVDPTVPLADVRLMSDYVDEAQGPTRFALTLIGAFGVLALILASVGLYGVLTFAVRQRTAEIGVRMAFGAEQGSIVRMVVRQGLALAGAGLTLGLLVSIPAAGAIESLLIGVTPTDPVTYLAIAGVFGSVAAVASYLPARRATRVDPVAALRGD